MIDFIANTAKVILFGTANRSGVSFDPQRDIPSLAGKVIFITGGANGLGKQAAIQFASHGPKQIYIADLPRADHGQSLINDIHSLVPAAQGKVSFFELDLSSFASIQRLVATFCEKENRLDICVLNAGIMRMQSGLTADGYEITFGINYLGHAILARLLMPTFLRTAAEPGADVRIVVLSSEGHTMVPRGGILFEKLKTQCEDVVCTCARTLATLPKQS
jgi:retinol dehydrogenase-12